MDKIKLNQYEIDILTEPFPIALGDIKNVLEKDRGLDPTEVKTIAIEILKRFFELGFLSFHVRLYYNMENKIKIVLNEPDDGYELRVDNKFWSSLSSETEIWNRLTIDNQTRLWDIGVDMSKEFYEKYYSPDDTEFWKLINQE